MTINNACITSCGHHFHKNCLEAWYNTGNTTCPICREVQPVNNTNIHNNNRDNSISPINWLHPSLITRRTTDRIRHRNDTNNINFNNDTNNISPQSPPTLPSTRQPSTQLPEENFNNRHINYRENNITRNNLNILNRD
tara:strand:- start:359 stop:772 length:414 start_codon:yes stop_codon:yes gene_type:complete